MSTPLAGGFFTTRAIWEASYGIDESFGHLEVDGGETAFALYRAGHDPDGFRRRVGDQQQGFGFALRVVDGSLPGSFRLADRRGHLPLGKIGRASCRERV